MTPILDLFCCAGGAAMGLYRGFIERYPDLLIVGVDNRPQPHYPAFHDAPYAKHFRFVQADALHPPFELGEFRFVWASPPCQRYSQMQHIKKNKQKYPDAVEPTRKLITDTGLPFVMENVEGAPLRIDVLLCGSFFGLGMIRHRIFEANFPLPFMVGSCNHSNMYDPWHWGNRQREEMARGMGIDQYMTREEVREAIPPAYSEYIARQITL